MQSPLEPPSHDISVASSIEASFQEGRFQDIAVIACWVSTTSARQDVAQHRLFASISKYHGSSRPAWRHVLWPLYSPYEQSVVGFRTWEGGKDGGMVGVRTDKGEKGTRDGVGGGGGRAFGMWRGEMRGG